MVRTIRKAKREYCENFLGKAQGEDLWTVVRYRAWEKYNRLDPDRRRRKNGRHLGK